MVTTLIELLPSELITEPKVHLWTREEYYKMWEMGLFEGKRVELIEGEIFEMNAISPPHATAASLADESLRKIFGKGWVMRIQSPITVSSISEPEPDVAVVAGQARDFKDAHPATAALVVEVADSSLFHDRHHKASLYAKADLADYWIVNLPQRQLEVHRRPTTDAEAEYGFSYAEKQIFKAGESVAPLAKPDVMIAVAELLP